MKIVLIFVITFIVSSCATVSSVDRPPSANNFRTNSNDNSNALLNDVLFGDNDIKINKILNYQVKLPEKNRIAILNLNFNQDNYWRSYSDELTFLSDSLVLNLIQSLRSSKRIFDASFLPAILVSKNYSIPILREAAARFQADLLLVYRSSCNSYRKYRLLSKNENKSYCTIEAALIDTRSGIFTKSVVSTKNFIAYENDKDINFAETIKKAEIAALAEAFKDIAFEVVYFVDKTPILE